MSKNITRDEFTDNENDGGSIFEPYDQDVTKDFQIIPNDLQRHPTLSPECIWLIGYLCGHEKGWNINVKQLTRFLKGRWGRDKILRYIKEACENGYMLRTVYFKPNIVKGVDRGGKRKCFKYSVASRPIFKKSFRCPENQETGDQKPEIQLTGFQLTGDTGTKENNNLKNTIVNTSYSQSRDVFPSSDPLKIKEEFHESLDIPDKKPRRAKIPKEFSPEVKEIAQKMIDIIQSKNEMYRPPPDMSKFYEEVRIMIEDEKHKPETLLQTFTWGVNDDVKSGSFNGWGAVLCSNGTKSRPKNPASIFRSHASTLYAQMKARPASKVNPNVNLMRNDDGSLYEPDYLKNEAFFT